MVPGEVDDRLADHFVRVAGVRLGAIEAEDARHGVGPVERVLAEAAPELLDLDRREGQNAAVELGAEGMEPELERRRDPEVPAGAAQAPEELGLLGLGRADEAAIGRDELNSRQVVDRESEVALEAADSPTERQPGNAGVADDPGRADEAELLRGDVQLTEERAAVRPCGSSPTIRLDATHRGHVDEEAAVRASEPGRAVTAGSDRDLEVVLAREADRGGDLLGGRGAGDDRRAPIVDRVPQAARVVVAGVLGHDHLGARATQLLHVAWRDPSGYLDHPSPSLVHPGELTRWSHDLRSRVSRPRIYLIANRGEHPCQ